MYLCYRFKYLFELHMDPISTTKKSLKQNKIGSNSKTKRRKGLKHQQKRKLSGNNLKANMCRAVKIKKRKGEEGYMEKNLCILNV